jgi:hypothetical protein
VAEQPANGIRDLSAAAAIDRLSVVSLKFDLEGL